MRKFFYFLLLLPAIAALGHDIYFYTQNQEKGFQLSAVGWLWDKYHKESHDQWTARLGVLDKELAPYESKINEAVGVSKKPQVAAGYENEVIVENKRGQDTVVKEEAPSKEAVQEGLNGRPTLLVSLAGSILKQKAVVVFGLLALGVFMIDVVFRFIFGLFASIGGGSKTRKASQSTQYKYGRK